MMLATESRVSPTIGLFFQPHARPLQEAGLGDADVYSSVFRLSWFAHAYMCVLKEQSCFIISQEDRKQTRVVGPCCASPNTLGVPSRKAQLGFLLFLRQGLSLYTALAVLEFTV